MNAPTETGASRSPTGIRHVVTGVTVLGAAAVAASAVLVAGLPGVLPLVVAVAVIAMGDMPIVHIRHGEETHSFNWSEASLVAGLVLLPAWWLPIVGAVVVAARHALLQRPGLKTLFNAMSFTVAAFLATTALVTVEQVLGGTEWVGLSVACAVYFVWNTSAVSLAVARSRGVTLREVIRSGLLLATLFAVANASVSILVAIAATREPLVLIVLPPVIVQLIIAYRNTREVLGERDLWESIQGVSEELQQADVTDLPRVALEAACDLVGSDTAELLTVEGTRAARHRWSGGELVSATGPVEQLADDVWGRVECDRSTFWLQRATASPRQRAWLEDEEVGAALVLPLEWGGRLLGLLRFGFRSGDKGLPRVESVLSTVATQVASTITSHRQTATLRHQAEHDQLTGLPNRTRLVRELQRRLERPLAEGSGLAVLFFDLDDFKVVNDSLGHHVGDGMLLEAARRLRSAMRPRDAIARFGGDEFVVICDQLNDQTVAGDIAQRLLDSLAEPTVAGPRDAPIAASVGIAYSDGDDADPETLLRDADAAMYEAKRSRPGSYCMFSSGLRTQVLERLHLEADLRDALQQDEIQVHYQPIVDVSSGAIGEYEALARWHHPTRGPVSPGAFISVAEDSGQIRRLGEKVLNRSCADMRHWLDLGLARPDQRVAVNLSARQLDHTLPTIVGEALARNGLPATSLRLEVTESALVDDPDAVSSLQRLREIGVTVSLDDFGTGYSSLSALRDLPVDTVKVDRSFVSGLGKDVQLAAMVKGIVDLAHALGMTVVAEGVELGHTAQVLGDIGCDHAQGWFHGRPMPAALVEDSLRTAPAPPADDATRPTERAHLRLA